MAIICTDCGYAYNSDDAGNCSICNGTLQSLHSESNRRLYDPESNELQDLQSDRPDSINAGIQTNRQNESPAPSGQVSENPPANEQILEGRISHIERNDERPPRDAFRFMAKFLIGILFFIPFLGLFIISSCLSLAFAIIGFRSLSQLFNPFVWSTSIFELMEILVLRRIKGTDTIPVYRGMVEDIDSQEYSFIFRGPIRAGNLIAGHNIRLFGHIERGTFVSQGGMDLTSNSEIVSEYRNPWCIIFYFILALYIIIGLGLYLNLPQIAGYYG